MTSINSAIDVGAPREDLINTAVKFIINPNVQKSPRQKKEEFLKSKGLTDEEIRLAFERSNASVQNVPPATHPHIGQPFKGQPYLPLQHYPVVTPFQKFRDLLHTVSLLVGAGYGIYIFFKRVVLPFLFGKPKKPEGVEGQVHQLKSSVNKSISDLRAEIVKVQSELEQVVVFQNEHRSTVTKLGDIKSEIATVKGILLSRHQFPEVGSASIPAWQMAACPDERSSEVEASEPNRTPSNGGSQGSDSSLEMIKEVEVAETEAIMENAAKQNKR